MQPVPSAGKRALEHVAQDSINKRFTNANISLNYSLYSFIHSTHMQDLKEVTQETHYENFRATQLSGESPINPISNEDLIDAPKNGKRYGRD